MIYVLRRTAHAATLAACLFLLSGCFALPKWQVFQAKVPAPLVESPKKIEAERQAADLLARKVETPVEMKQVAQELSSSLGEPAKPIPDTPKASVVAVAALQEGQRIEQKQFAQLNQRLAKYQGKEIEDTGFNAFAPTTALGVVGLVAACIFVPGFLTFLLFFIRKLFATIRILVANIKTFEAENPEAADKLKTNLSKSMDAVHKKLIRSVKSDLVKEGA